MDETTRSKIEVLSKKIGVDMKTLEDQYQQLLTNVASLYPNKDANWHAERARHLLYAKYVGELRSPSVAFDVVFISASEVVDYNAMMRNFAIEQFKLNPQKAIDDGLVFQDGTPRDYREWLVEPTEGRAGRRNPNFNKPLKPFKQRRVLGFAARFGSDKVKLLSATLREPACDAELPMNKPVTTRLNIRGEDDYTIYAVSGRRTTLDKASTNPVFKDWNEQKTIDLLEKAPFKIDIYKVEEWHEKNSNNPQAVVLLDAFLMGKADEPTERGSYYLRLGNIEDLDYPPVTCFIDEDEHKKLEGLGTGTRLLTLGTTTTGLDLMTQERTAVIINGHKLFVTMPVKAEELDIISARA